MLCWQAWTRPIRRIAPSNGRLIGSAPLSFSSVLNARSRERGLSCRARRTGCFPTRPGFTKSFTKADSVGFGINFASREADWSTSRRRSASFPCLCFEPRRPASASAKQGPTKETTAPFGLLRCRAPAAYQRDTAQFRREARLSAKNGVSEIRFSANWVPIVRQICFFVRFPASPCI